MLDLWRREEKLYSPSSEISCAVHSLSAPLVLHYADCLFSDVAAHITEIITYGSKSLNYRKRAFM